MPQQSLPSFYAWISARLRAKQYQELVPPPALQHAWVKPGVLGDPYLVAVKDAVHTTDSPQQIFAGFDAWAKQGWGHRVTAVLLFVYWQPPTAVTEDIQKLTGGQTFAGVHDLFSGRHWMSNYIGMEQEIYGD